MRRVPVPVCGSADKGEVSTDICEIRREYRRQRLRAQAQRQNRGRGSGSRRAARSRESPTGRGRERQSLSEKIEHKD